MWIPNGMLLLHVFRLRRYFVYVLLCMDVFKELCKSVCCVLYANSRAPITMSPCAANYPDQKRAILSCERERKSRRNQKRLMIFPKT